MTTAPCFPPNPILAHWHTLAHPAVCQGEPVCQSSVPAQPAAPVARRWCRSTCSARAVRFRWSRRPAPTPFTHRPTLAHLGTLAHPGTPVPTAGVPGSANSNRLKVRLHRFPASTAKVISRLAHWHTCISFFTEKNEEPQTERAPHALGNILAPTWSGGETRLVTFWCASVPRFCDLLRSR